MSRNGDREREEEENKEETRKTGHPRRTFIHLLLNTVNDKWYCNIILFLVQTLVFLSPQVQNGTNSGVTHIGPSLRLQETEVKEQTFYPYQFI